jgi:hypothetical protein
MAASRVRIAPKRSRRSRYLGVSGPVADRSDSRRALLAWIGNLLFGASVGYLAAVLRGMSLILGLEARMAKIDANLLAAVLAAQAAFGKDLSRSYRRPAAVPRFWAAAFWLALGAGRMLTWPNTALDLSSICLGGLVSLG